MNKTGKKLTKEEEAMYFKAMNPTQAKYLELFGNIIVIGFKLILWFMFFTLFVMCLRFWI